MDWDFTDKNKKDSFGPLTVDKLREATEFCKQSILDEQKDLDTLYFECYKCGMFGIDHQSTIIHRSVPLVEGKLYKGMIVLCNDCKPKEY